MGVTLQADGWMRPDDPRDAWIRQQPDGLFDLRFERDIPRPPEKVWAALTLPERIAAWLGPPILIELRVGGRYLVADAGGGEDALFEWTIVRCDPPRLLVMEFFSAAGDVMLHWQITPTAEGSRLVLRQTGSSAFWTLGLAPGWMGIVDDLVSVACDETAKDIEGGYHAAVERYKRDYGPFTPGFDMPPALRHNEAPAYVVPEGGGRYTLRFCRHWMVPLEALWTALTDPARLADWLGVAKIDPRVGGEVDLRWPTHDTSAHWVVRELDAPSRMVWASTDPGAPDATVRWLLFQDGPDTGGPDAGPQTIGTRVMLRETGVPARDLLSVASGWHAHLYELPEAALRERPLAWSAEREVERSERRIAELANRYRERIARDAPDSV
jgi:uncharacterized protein YndB with AHSA1/START domain